MLEIKKKGEIFLEWSLISCIATLPYPSSLSNISLVVAGVLAIGICFEQLPLLLRSIGANKVLLLLISLFVLHVIGLTYSTNFDVGMNKVERAMPLLLFPIVMSAISVTERFKSQVLNAVVFSSLLAAVICFLGAAILSFKTGQWFTYNPENKVNEYHFYYHSLAGQIRGHAVYLSAYIAFGILISFRKIQESWYESGFYKRLVHIVVILILVTFLFFLKSAIISLSLVLGLMIILTSSLVSKRSFRLTPTVVLLLIFMIAMSGFVIYNKVGFDDIGKFEYSDGAHSGKWTNINIRMAKWQSSLEIIGENFLFGVGTGDYEQIMQNQYKKNGFQIGFDNSYNAHNQYLEYGISFGLLGMVIFVTCLMVAFKSALKNRDIIFIVFLIIFSFFCLTESVLSRNKGVVFFAFFMSFFAIDLKKQSR